MRQLKKMLLKNAQFLVYFVPLVIIIFWAYVSFVGIQHAYLEQHQEANQCVMSWMYPNYVVIDVPQNKFSYKYKLFLYKEGKDYAKQNADSVKLEGVPVLFVHGHAGSYKQGRSLGVATATSTTPTNYPDSHIDAVVCFKKYNNTNL